MNATAKIHMKMDLNPNRRLVNFRILFLLSYSGGCSGKALPPDGNKPRLR
jgi:hypothetical protein